MIDREKIIVDLLQKYNIPVSTLKKLKTFLGKIDDYKYLYSSTEVPLHASVKRSVKIETSPDGIYLTPKEYYEKKCGSVTFAVIKHGKQHKLFYYRLVATNQLIDYKDIQRRFSKYYYIHLGILNIDTETIKRVLDYMFNEKKK